MKHVKSVLIIEDDLFQLKLLTRMVEDVEACSVTHATNAKEAKTACEEYSFDVIFCDLNLPDYDGMALIRHLATTQSSALLVINSAEHIEISKAAKSIALAEGYQHVSMLEKPIKKASVNTLLKHSTPKKQPSNQQLSFTDKDVLSAYKMKQFVPFFQPQFSAKSDTIESLEALIRWQHPIHGEITPFYFLDGLKKLGLLSRVSHLMLEESIKFAKQLTDKGHLISVSVNIPPSELEDTLFTSRVLKLLSQYNLPNNLLTIEVVETESYSNKAAFLETLARLRMHKIGLAIDDFGIGYSSLLELMNSPFTEIKIDRAFISKMIEDKKYQGTVKAIAELATNLNMKTVAEGAECKEEVDYLKEIGIDLVQGYYYSPAVSKQAIIHSLYGHSASTKAF